MREQERKFEEQEREASIAAENIEKQAAIAEAEAAKLKEEARKPDEV